MKNYIPKTKNDLDAVEALKSMPFELIQNEVPQLLEWMQDMNWPVGRGIADYLLPHVCKIQLYLINILMTDDDMWKYWILCNLIKTSPERPTDELMSLVKRIADYPTSIEKESEVDEMAKEVIAKFS